MTVYIVTSGYSDFNIENVFTQKDKAQEFIDMMESTNLLRSNYSIHSWETDNMPSDMIVSVVMVNDQIFMFNKMYWEYAWFSDALSDADSMSDVIEITERMVTISKNFKTKDGYFKFDYGCLKDKEFKFPIFIVQGLIWGSKEILRKTAQSEIERYKATKEGI